MHTFDLLDWLVRAFVSLTGLVMLAHFVAMAGYLKRSPLVVRLVLLPALAGIGMYLAGSGVKGDLYLALYIAGSCAAVVALMYFLLPSASSSLPWVMAVLFVLFLSFEGAVVGGLSLYSELVPEARSIVLSIIFGGLNLGFALGSWLGTRVWGMAGLEATCYIAGLLTLIALGLFYWFVEEAGEVRSMKGSHSTIS